MTYWFQSAKAYCHVLNRLPRKVLGGVSSYQKRNGRKPSTRYIRMFGAKCYYKPLVQKVGKDKRPCTPGILVGYVENANEYEVFDPKKKKITRTRSATFYEADPAKPEKIIETFCEWDKDGNFKEEFLQGDDDDSGDASSDTDSKSPVSAAPMHHPK